MASLVFTWEHLWEFHKSSDAEIKARLENEVIGDGWLYRQTSKDQIEILKSAPIEFIQTIAKELKPDTQIRFGINPYRERCK